MSATENFSTIYKYVFSSILKNTPSKWEIVYQNILESIIDNPITAIIQFDVESDKLIDDIIYRKLIDQVLQKLEKGIYIYNISKQSAELECISMKFDKINDTYVYTTRSVYSEVIMGSFVELIVQFVNLDLKTEGISMKIHYTLSKPILNEK
jgi:hypothetical protein